MTSDGFEKLMTDLAAAWTRKDHAWVCTAFADDVHYSDPTRYTFNGLKVLREFFESSEVENQRCDIHVTIFDESRQIGAAEYSYEGEHRYHGMVLVRLVADKIILWREYQHIDARTWTDFIAGQGIS